MKMYDLTLKLYYLCFLFNFLLIGCVDSDQSESVLEDQAVVPMINQSSLDMGDLGDFTIDTMTTIEEFQLCTGHMSTLLSDSYQTFCADYSEIERQDPSSGYFRDFVVAACLYLTCDNKVLEGHNGVMIGKKCNDLEDLMFVLSQAVDQAVVGDQCTYPDYQVRLLTYDEFMGGERCDQLQCSISADGVVIESN